LQALIARSGQAVAGYQDGVKFETLRWIGNAANFSAHDPPGTISL